MRLGIVSTADINRKVIPGAHASEKVDLVAVASRDQARAEEYARTWEIERAYGTYEALLAGVVSGTFASAPDAVAACVRVRETVEPNPARARVYADGYARYRALYPAIRGAEA